ncbi:phage holin family protein [Garciella nitratireducens]|uniref:Toxin secretion/phage lysis holin n=1 Tax=Garciella nitratireducens DSM 15102 TaxID=1121911 RepID=A0A1T4K5N8_9FIRM|nr:phage holin family protein [Garciella nitratireducens]SJZ37653.1 toxin secretion/phage lysis holin [Garciella nitratireducens DSM 15102]
MEYKHTILTSFGIVGSIIAHYLGGWDTALQTLIIFMAIDYIAGLITAGVFHRSGKTDNGRLESKAGFKGLCKKGMILLIVLVATQLDLVIGTDVVRNAVIIAFTANEAISILENAGTMGIKIPKKLTDAIEILKDKGEEK